MQTDTNRPVAIWLILCCILVFAMIVLGGVTRLTRSGLSIVEWQPIIGAIPPLSDAAWEEAFAKYRQTPEYQKVNVGMSLAAFKSIYWVEYAHRLLGRLIALVFLAGFLVLLVQRRIPPGLAGRLIGLFVLGGLQGALGWYMVASGLVDEPRVSPYRLTAHLGLAVLIYGYMWWLALGLLHPRPWSPSPAPRQLKLFGWIVSAAIFLMILSGGLVAGTRAGFAFNTFPLMHGVFVPPGAFALSPWWINLFENVATVQFDHRLLAYTLVALVAGYIVALRRAPTRHSARAMAWWLAAALALQVGLGIATLVYVVPIPLAAAHQAGALLVLTLSLTLNHRLAR